MIVTHASDVGCIRETNEDNYLCVEPNIYAVADGMGGHAAGEIASRIMVNSLREGLETAIPDSCDEDYLRKVILQGNQAILLKSKENEAYNGMGTTVSLLYLHFGYANWAHVGDSRIYRLRNGSLEQLTNDHSLVNELLQQQKITDEEAQNYPNKNILTRAAGVSPLLAVDSGSCDIKLHDIFIVCSDGLTNMVDNNKIIELCQHPDVTNKAKRLLSEAIANGGKDNITCIVVEIE